MLSDNPTAMHVLLATIHLQCWRNEGVSFLDHILTGDISWMQSFDPHMKQHNAEWVARMSSRKKIAWSSRGALEALHVMLFC